MDAPLTPITARLPAPGALPRPTVDFVEVGRVGHWLMVAAHGSINAATAALLHTRLHSALTGHLLVAVNLADAHLADASGLAVLIGAHRRAHRDGRVLVVVAATSHTTQILHTTGLDHRLLTSPTLADFLTWSGTHLQPPTGTATRPHKASDQFPGPSGPGTATGN